MSPLRIFNMSSLFQSQELENSQCYLIALKGNSVVQEDLSYLFIVFYGILVTIQHIRKIFHFTFRFCLCKGSVGGKAYKYNMLYTIIYYILIIF